MDVNSLTPRPSGGGGVSESVSNDFFRPEIWGEVAYRLFTPDMEIGQSLRKGQRIEESDRGWSLPETV